MMPNPPGPSYPPGNGDIWKFTGTSYERYQHGQLTASGTYSLTKDTCPATGRFMDAFLTKQNYRMKIFFEFSKDTLVMYQGIIAADGAISKYVKLEEP